MEAADVVAVPVPPNENPADVPVLLAAPPVPKLNAILNSVHSLFKIIIFLNIKINENNFSNFLFPNCVLTRAFQRKETYDTM